MLMWFNLELVHPTIDLLGPNASTVSLDAPHDLPAQPPSERIATYLEAFRQRAKAEAARFDWESVSIATQAALDQKKRWHSYSEAARVVADSADEAELQRHIDSVNGCLNDGAACDYLQEVNRVISALERQRLGTLVRVVEGM